MVALVVPGALVVVAVAHLLCSLGRHSSDRYRNQDLMVQVWQHAG